MKNCKLLYNLEWKQVLSKKNIGLFLFLSFLSLYFVQIGINNYLTISENKKIFQNFEQLKVTQYLNYGQYGTYGVRVFFIPSRLSIYFVNSSTLAELTSNVDAGERLNIYNSFKGRTLFTEKSGGFKDFSGIMLLLGSLLVLYLGYESFIHKDYLRVMSGFFGSRRIFFVVIFSRVLAILLFSFLNMALSLVLVHLNGIRLQGNDYLYLAIYLAILTGMLIFFFSIGTITGSFKSRFVGFVTVIISWFFLVFFLPGVVGSLTYRKAETIISDYKLEIEKLKTLMSFEKWMKTNIGTPEKSNAELVKKAMDGYLRNEFKKIQAFEQQLANEMKENIRFYEIISIHFPSTFYLSAGNEISSKGYENFSRFYDYIQGLKRKFVRFIFFMRYDVGSSRHGKPGQKVCIKSFIKADENIYPARSRLPGVFSGGILYVLVYTIVILVASYFRFKKTLKV